MNESVYSDFQSPQKLLSALFCSSVMKSTCFLDGIGVSSHVSSDSKGEACAIFSRGGEIVRIEHE